jgi:hypothetical protein
VNYDEDVCVAIEVLQELLEAPEAALHTLDDALDALRLLVLRLLVYVLDDEPSSR